MSIQQINENDDISALRDKWESILRQVGIEPNDQTRARFDNMCELQKLVGNVYPNKFARSERNLKEDTVTNLKTYEPIVKIVEKMDEWKKAHEGERPPVEFKDGLNAELKAFKTVRVSGRLTTPTRGNFVHLTDGINKLQVYCDKKGGAVLVKNDGNDTLDTENGWAAWQLLDHGDFIGVEGYLFITNTGELSVHIEKLQFLAKAMLPMPDKMHGIADVEIRQRQRYYDLIGSSLQIKTKEEVEEEERTGQKNYTTREVFERRAKVISSMRNFLEDHDYVEVETPMLTPKATGAVAKPFKTHHKALDIDLYARIAPELYLKRLMVGGFEKVYELNRNFRNEGISYKHNPEFTMLEFYCAYMDVRGMMDFCEELMRQSVQKATGSLTVNYEGNEIDFEPKFERITMKQAIVRYRDEYKELGGEQFGEQWLNDPDTLKALRLLTRLLDEVFVPPTVFGDDVANIQKITEARYAAFVRDNKDKYWEVAKRIVADTLTEAEAKEYDIGELGFWKHVISEYGGDTEVEMAKTIQFMFEDHIEKRIVGPTFIIDYPKSISPLSKASPENPNIAERFELFINGMEFANGFSELNDPLEQYERFKEQDEERKRGDDEAMVLDEDYIRALSYGMPPAAGIGIGIDRLVMLLTNKHSIRDVILFPHLRPEKREEEKGSGGEEEKKN